MKKRNKTINTIKIVIVVLMAVAIAFSALAPVFGETVAVTTQEATRTRIREEARENIAVIREKLTEIAEDALTVPRETTRTARVQGVPAGFLFGYELRERATGEVVRYLQRVLNVDPQTRVAISGGGSPGNETTYFGPRTKQAVIGFQQKYEISATGIIGAQTRAKLNEVMQKGVSITEKTEEGLVEIRRRFTEVVQMMKQLREKLDQLDE